MTRRNFLKSLFGASAAALVPIGVLKWLQPEPSLAKSMVETTKESLMYQAIRQNS
jgi:hypothetical protein